MADSNEELVQTMKSAEASEGADRDHSRTRLIAGGGILGALAASSCCILPMAGGPHHDCVSCSYAVVIWASCPWLAARITTASLAATRW